MTDSFLKFMTDPKVKVQKDQEHHQDEFFKNLHLGISYSR